MADSNNATLQLVSVVSATVIFAGVIAAEPSKFTPPIALVVVNVAALPVVLWFNVGNVQFVNVPLAGVPSAGATKTIPEAIVPCAT